MHGDNPVSIESWLAETEWDDNRRFEMIKTILPNKRLLDFGCGAGGFLRKAKLLAAKVVGVELESRVREHWSNHIEIVPSVKSAGGGTI
jgi:cyclopropane fatty-acyl-phospholipid synthase-like methyltransferase